MAQGLLRTVQGTAIVVAQAIVLKHAFKFHQLGEYGIAVQGMKLDDLATGVACIWPFAHAPDIGKRCVAPRANERTTGRAGDRPGRSS